MTDRIFGHIPGILTGDTFSNRQELSFSRVHSPTQAGISGSQNEGADSIVLSGGYEDDKDFGDVIIYTGHGGRDINTGKQVTDQLLLRQNLALAKNCQSGLPVRVIRGYAHRSEFSPKSGYRYDGLFYVESYWKEKGRSGFDVWRFRLVKNADGEGFVNVVEEDEARYGNKASQRKETIIQRVIRDTAVSQHVKKLYECRCQVCKERILTNAGFYCEAAHIQPLGSPHNGPDIISNVLCLCPNHHVMFDFGGLAIADDFSMLGINGKLFISSSHRIDLNFIRYHRKHFWE